MDSQEAKKGDETAELLQNLNEACDPIEMISGAFASRKPKHVLQGLSDGAQNIALGVSMGVGSLCAISISGWKDGFTGVAKGVACGAISCVGLTAYGVFTGARQIARGAYHTSEAISKTIEGKRFWDSTEGKWVSIDLITAFSDLPVSDNDLMVQARENYRNLHKENGTAPVVNEAGAVNNATENNYYIILGVPKTATSAEIRAAFHQKAVEEHPDKKPNDPQATMRFQQIMEAYNTLSNQARRLQYDTNGKVDTASGQDTSFSEIENGFGAEFLFPFIGRIAWAMYLVPSAFFDGNLQKEQQRRRTLRISQWLSRYIDEDEHLNETIVAIRDAVLTRAGSKIMKTVAQQYATAARQHLHGGKCFRELDSFFSSKKAEVRHVADACAVAVKSVVKKKDDTDAVDIIVTFCEPDIRRTVLRACRYLLYDTSVSDDTRLRRASNMLKLSDLVLKEITKAENEALATTINDSS